MKRILFEIQWLFWSDRMKYCHFMGGAVRRLQIYGQRKVLSSSQIEQLKRKDNEQE